mmetsp:Transcript_25695/g.62937  ORF Transcript_25695/g.62937 Transcript_25695/m.62937 type:complete len:433 (+) Transcript_25695:78-1376(+)
MAVRVSGGRKRPIFPWKQALFLLLLFDVFHRRIPTTAPLSSYLNGNIIQYLPATITAAIHNSSEGHDNYIDNEDSVDEDSVKNEPMVIRKSDTPASIFHYTNNNGNAFGEARLILSAVLEEYEFVETRFANGRERLAWKQKHQHRNHPWDFFLLPLTETCNGIVFKWLMDDFKGNIIYISGESISDYMPLRMKGGRKFLIGPAMEENTDRVMTLTYLQMTWWGIFRPQLQQNKIDPHALLVEPSNRPQGKKEKKFLIYAASNCVKLRDQAYLALSSIGPASHGGKCKGGRDDGPNRTFVQNGISLSNWHTNVEFYSGFRFCLVMEHVYEQPYVTEKILMAFLGGCVPIYYGSTMVFDVFHPDSFIYYNVSNPSGALARVAHLEHHPEAYQKTMSYPILKNGNATLEKYFNFEGDTLKTKMRHTLKLQGYKFV